MSDHASKPGVVRMAIAVVMIGFVCNFLARGVVDSFMVLMVPLEAEFGWHHSDLTQVYSVYLIVLGIMSPLTGHLLDSWGPRLSYIAGLVILMLAMWVVSRTSAIWQLFVAFGLLCGLASSLIGMVPASALIGRWFDRHMSVGISIAYAGFGSGMLAIVPLVQAGIDSIGWRETYITMFWILAGLLPVMALLPWTTIGAGSPDNPRSLHMRGKPDAASPGAQWTVRTAVRTAEFWLLVQAFFFTAVASYLTNVQIIAVLIDRGYPPMAAALAFGAAGMLSIGGVIFSGWAMVRFGVRRTTNVSFIGTLTGILAMLAYSYWPHWSWVLLYVLAFGTSQGARGPVISSLNARIFAHGRVNSIYGLIFMIMSLGSAFGAWMSGQLHGWTGDYTTAFAVAGVAVLLAMAPFTVSRRLTAARMLPPPSKG